MGNCITSNNPREHEQFTESRFNFIELLGKGTFGEVWKVSDRRSGELFALKIMDKMKIVMSKMLQSIIREKKILETLALDRSDLISNMKATFQDKEKIYILMEFIAGRNLRAYIAKKVRLNQQQIKFVVVTLLKIVRYLHSKNIIHGDIKPENIMINAQGLPHLLDFCLASFYTEDNANEDGGTLPYMAPEVVMGLNHNFTIDYYAIGIIAFQLFFHKRPHRSQTYEQLKKEILRKQINFQSCPELSEISPLAADFIIQLVHRNPEKRLGNNSINDIFDHPWISSEGNQSLIVCNECGVFQNWNEFQKQDKQIEKSSPINTLMRRKMLDYDHIQKMFRDFNLSNLDQKTKSDSLVAKRSFSLTISKIKMEQIKKINKEN